MTEEIDQPIPIEPSPRILQMLGHVNFQGWQCLAELIDNSIDAFLTDRQHGRPRGEQRIEISLPSPTELETGRAVVEIRDNASGMSLAQVQDAVRAGYSGNDPITKLGLFGMGFNVSTARIGLVTEILSHRPEDPEWIGIRIDIDHMVKNRTWSAPIVREPLTAFDGPSGTKVRITRIPRQGVVRSMIYGRGKSSLLKKLSRVYHIAMERHGVQILVNGTPLAPWRLCIWGDSRSVPSQAWMRVPAQFPVDIALQPLPYCTSCWEWGADGQTECLLCGATMTSRERRIRGTLGIQRSFSVAWGEGQLGHFGIDLIRNGRVIEEFDKDLFDWIDPSDPNHREIDYPVDSTYLGGRIIGELELDFVPLRSYHKDSFEKSDPTWGDVREALRGREASLRPDVSRKKGYERPDTILARLFDGYRKSSPAGERTLMTAHPPGTKTNPTTPMTTSSLLETWIAGFEAGDPEFLVDDHWWEAVQWAEASTVETPDDEVIVSIFDEPAEPSHEPKEEDVPPAQPSDADALEVVPDALLSVTVVTEDIVQNAPSFLEVKAFKVVHGQLPNSYSVSVDPHGPEIHFTWNPKHPDFALSLRHPLDCLVGELAFQVLYRAQVTQRDYPLSFVEREIVRRTFPDRDQSIDKAAERAADLLQAMKAFLTERLVESELGEVSLDEVDTRELARAAAAAGVPNAQLPSKVQDGSFIELMPVKFLPKCALLFPGVLMGDQGFFALDYQGYDTEELRKELRESLFSSLIDVLWLVDQRANMGAVLSDLARIQLQKSLSALELLELRRSG